MKRNKFNLSNYKLLSCDMGELVPIGLQEVLPGDSFQHSTSALIRLSPLLAPMMHPVHVRIHHWFVPHRLVWEDWEDFITGGPDGEDDSVLPLITFGGGGAAVGSLADYLGVPTGVNGLAVSALPFRAYALIYNEFYRDQDLVSELAIDETSGPDTTTSVALQNVAWEKDYFTLARPWPQKGPDITIPLGTTAPVVPVPGENIQWRNSADATARTVNTNTTGSVTMATNPANNGAAQWSVSGLQVDLSNATAATINLIREAFALQRMQEARARFGSRYVDYLAYLGVRSSDARLQRPEYLGGGRQVLQISEVLQTGVTTDGDDSEGVGNLKGHGIGALRSNRYRRFFEEHGYVLSLLSVKPRTIYAQGLPRTWSRQVKEDFWQKELQHIGQQEVLNKELYAAHSSPDGVFGYSDRYDEYRRQESTIAGEFRSTLNFWHMARLFNSDPTLNASFITSNPTDRVFATPSTDNLWIMAQHSLIARRLVASHAGGSIF